MKIYQSGSCLFISIWFCWLNNFPTDNSSSTENLSLHIVHFYQNFFKFCLIINQNHKFIKVILLIFDSANWNLIRRWIFIYQVFIFFVLRIYNSNLKFLFEHLGFFFKKFFIFKLYNFVYCIFLSINMLHKIIITS